MLGLSLTEVALRRRGPAEAAAPAPTPSPTGPLSAVLADGWSATYPSPPAGFTPDSAPAQVTVTRAGFDASGTAVSMTEQLVITARVRQPYPDQAQLTADRVALSDYVYAGDAIEGAVNNSAEASPKPVANWIMPHRLVVGNVVELELVAFHRNARAGRQVACVEFRATDGTTTVTQLVAATAVSNRPGDRNAVVSYKAALDISTLADNALVTCNARVFPWIGGASSVLDSSGQATLREFSPRYFLKNTSLAAAPFTAYVDCAGSDASGVASASDASAAASPCLTIAGAITKIVAAAGKLDGAVIRVRAGSFILSAAAATHIQNVGCLTITRDPAVAHGAAIVTWGAAVFRPRIGNLTAPIATGCIRFSDLTVQRTGTSTMQGEAAANLELIYDRCTLDTGAYVATLYSATAHDSHFGTTFPSPLVADGQLGVSSTIEHRCLRGIAIDAAYKALEGWLIVGSEIERCGALSRSAAGDSGAIIACNKLKRIGEGVSPVTPINWGGASSIAGAACVQNSFEWTGATSGTAIRISADNAAGSNAHILLLGNSFAGFDVNGRVNLFYDEGTTPRTSRLMAVKGNIFVQDNRKSDVVSQDGTRTGNWAAEYGVGFQGNLTQFVAVDAPEYGGLGANMGTSSSVRKDPLYAVDGAWSSARGASNGPGGSVLTLQAASPAKAMVTSAMLSHALDGAARPASSDSAGAYSATI